VGTGFINYAMPLIRYRTGDVCSGIERGCPECGRNYDIISAVEGRIGDFLINAEGKIISVYLDIDFGVFNNIERFQLYQESPGEVELRIWPKNSYGDEDSDRIVSEIQRAVGQLGRGLKYRIVMMEKSGRDSSVKYRMVDQRLDIRKLL
jgi:phenylacetate-CoA ligase